MGARLVGNPGDVWFESNPLYLFQLKGESEVWIKMFWKY